MPYYNEVQISDYARRILNGSEGVSLRKLFNDAHSIQAFEIELFAYAPPMGVNLNLFEHVSKRKLARIDPKIPAKFKWDSYRNHDIKTLLKKFALTMDRYLAELLKSEQSVTDHVAQQTFSVEKSLLSEQKKACIIALKSLRQTCCVLLEGRISQRNSVGIPLSIQKMHEQELPLLSVLLSLSPHSSRAVRIESALQNSSEPLSATIARTPLRVLSQSLSAKKTEKQIARAVALGADTPISQHRDQLPPTVVKRTVSRIYQPLEIVERKERAEVVSTVSEMGIDKVSSPSHLTIEPMARRLLSPARSGPAMRTAVVEKQQAEQFFVQSPGLMQEELARTQLLMTQKVAELSKFETKLSEVQTEHAREKKKMSEELGQYRAKKRETKQELEYLSQKKQQLRQDYAQVSVKYTDKVAELESLKKQYQPIAQSTDISEEQSQVLKLLKQQLENKFLEINKLKAELNSLRQRYSFSESQRQVLELQLQEIRTELEDVKSTFRERNQELEARVVELQAMVDSNTTLIAKLKADLQEREQQLAEVTKRLQLIEVSRQREMERHPRKGVGLSPRVKDAELHKLTEVIKTLQSKLAVSISEQDWQRLNQELAQKSSALMTAEQQLAERSVKEAAQLKKIELMQQRFDELEAAYKENLSAIEVNGQKLIAELKEERERLESAQVIQFKAKIQELTGVHQKQLELLKAHYLEKEKAASESMALQVELKSKIEQLQAQFEIDKMGIREKLNQQFQDQFQQLEKSYGVQFAQLKRLQAEQRNALENAQQANFRLEGLVRDLRTKLDLQTELFLAKEQLLQEAERRRVAVEDDLSRLQAEQLQQAVKLQEAQDLVQAEQRNYTQRLQQLQLEFTKQKEVLEQDLRTAKEQYVKKLQTKEAEIVAVQDSLREVEVVKASLQLQMQQPTLAKETVLEQPGSASALESELTELRETNKRLMQVQDEIKVSAEERVNKYKTQFQQAQQINDDQQKLYDELEKERDELLDDLERLTSEKNVLQVKIEALSQPVVASLQSPLRTSQKANELAVMHQELMQSLEVSMQSPVRVLGKENKPVTSITPKPITPKYSSQTANAGAPSKTPAKSKTPIRATLRRNPADE